MVLRVCLCWLACVDGQVGGPEGLSVLASMLVI